MFSRVTNSAAGETRPLGRSGSRTVKSVKAARIVRGTWWVSAFPFRDPSVLAPRTFGLSRVEGECSRKIPTAQELGQLYYRRVRTIVVFLTRRERDQRWGSGDGRNGAPTRARIGVAYYQAPLRPNKRLHLTEGALIKSDWRSSRFKTLVSYRINSSAVYPCSVVLPFPPQVKRGRWAVAIYALHLFPVPQLL